MYSILQHTLAPCQSNSDRKIIIIQQRFFSLIGIPFVLYFENISIEVRHMDTTLNIHADILKKIADSACSRGMHRSELIVLLLNKIMDETRHSVRMGRLVQYQKRRPRGEWRRIHARFEADEYEYFLDLRKLMKMSLSHILAVAVEKYIDAICREKNPDNNRYTNYLIINEEIDSVSCWRLIWGNPPSITKHLWPGK